MKVVYATEAFPIRVTKTLFLAGPTPRSSEVESWRPEALRLLEELGYDGHVFVPEPRDSKWHGDYMAQVEWEEEGLKKADVIVFWVPRDMKAMPALTTNDEWGTWKHARKVVWGNPPDAPKCSYQRYYAKKLGIPVSDSLQDILESALKEIGEGAIRNEGETWVPLRIWGRPDFQNWYQSVVDAGNVLTSLDVCWEYVVKSGKTYVYTLHPHIYVSGENRTKDNEVVVLRSDISCVALIEPNPEDFMQTRVALIREFRSPVNNEAGFVYELPGGSSLKEGADPRQTAAEEVFEEVGIEVDPKRIVALGSRQMGATLVSYHAHLFMVELTSEEMDALDADKEAHGAGDTEKTYVEVQTLGQIMAESLVDWPMIGMLTEAMVAWANRASRV